MTDPAKPKTSPSISELHAERKKLWDASISNHARYMNKTKLVFAKKFTEERRCPACDKNDFRNLFAKSGGNYVACNICGMVYLNPVFKDQYLREYYETNHSLQGDIVESDLEFYSRLYNKGLSLISKALVHGSQILDVGCSTGIFLDIAKNSGWKTFGLELNKKEAATAAKKGHLIQEAIIELADFKTEFCAISLWDVFEHIKDGRQFLEDAKRILKKGGVVFLQSPSRDSLAARILQSACNMFDGLEHVNLYGRESLEVVAKSAGYEIVNFETVISEIGVTNNYLDYADPYLGKSKFGPEVAGLISEAEIHKNYLGYKFQACLKAI